MKKRSWWLALPSTLTFLVIYAIIQQQPSFASTPTPLIVDDDGSQDGLAALSFLLTDPKFEMKAITMSHGVARPENPTFQKGLKRMLGYLNATDIPVGIGSSVPLVGNNAFPDFVRSDPDKFYSPFVTLPEEVPDIEFKSAAQLIVDTVNNSPEPVTIFSAGSLTNIAQAIRIDPTIVNNIGLLQIMGGAIDVPGNLGITPEPPYSTNTTAEFNIWLDPVASQEVFEAGSNGLKIKLTPLDATDQIAFSRADYQAWLDTGTPESILAAQFLDFSLVVVGGDVNPNPFWDMVGAIDLSEPNFATDRSLHLQVDTTSPPGGTQGKINVLANLPPNADVSFDPSFENISFDSDTLFSAYSETIPEPSTILGLVMWGGGAIIATQRRRFAVKT